jgi:hypothetical protein
VIELIAVDPEAIGVEMRGSESTVMVILFRVGSIRGKGDGSLSTPAGLIRSSRDGSAQVQH